MGIKRAMVNLESTSGIAADRVVNTFHFTPASDPIAIYQALTEFYNGANGALNTVAYWLSPYLDRAALKCEVRVYDLADAKPREPTIFKWTLGAANSAQLLPREIAVALSYYGDRNIRRQRGRIYIGPLSVNAIGNRVGDQGIVPELRDSLATAATRLKNEGPSAQWIVYSELNASATGSEYAGQNVTAGWVDDAVDIQRRRGLKPAVRTAW